MVWSAFYIVSMERVQQEIVHVDPNRTTPIVFILAIVRILLGKGANTVWRPNLIRIMNHVQNGL